ncbi:MAG: hypothetical protein V2I36_04495 [Desulfopila sp.]|jgi:hypothetical protein|nr:hypothetical protein [Desulfopila sp.]
MEWLKKNRDWLITLAVFLCFALALLLYNVFFRDKEGSSPAPLEIREKVTFDRSGGKDSPAGEISDTPNAAESASFFLQPGPEELFGKLENLSRQEFKEETQKLPGLKVMWPAYFFSLQHKNDKTAEIVLDSSEDGFGIILVSEIDIQRYPEILDLQRGEKIWLAAEITGVDPTGTGQFFLTTEFVRFGDYQPPGHKLKDTENETNQ